MQLPLPAVGTAIKAAMIAALLGSLLALRLTGRADGTTSPTRALGPALRSRFVLGVPWGTLVSVAFVLVVYLFVQGGLARWHRPVTVAFSSWSYFYPVGWLSAAFSHSGPGHLLGNLFGTVAFAPLAEYFFSHYPTDRGSTSFASWRTNPYVRAFLVFPLAVLGVGVLTSLFSWGPVIGFSGVVFAFAGFALVRYPIAVLVALTIQDAVGTFYDAFRTPIHSVTASPSYSSPWWAEIAIQGHTLGLFVGVVLGVLLLYRRDVRPDRTRLWIGALGFAVTLNLWAIYWFRGSDTYVLYQGPGAVFVLVLATVLALVPQATDRPVLRTVRDWQTTAVGFAFALLVAPEIALVARALDGVGTVSLTWPQTAALALAGALLVGAGVRALSKPLLADLTRRQLAVVVLVVPLIVMAGVAVPTNLRTLDDESVPGDGPAVQTGGYSVTYAEDVPNQLVSVVDVSAFGETTKVNTSGVIVVNPDREIWVRDVSKGRLAFAGRAAVRVGGVGWRETVRVQRLGWSANGGGTAYQVWLKPPDDGWFHAYSSDPVQAGPVLAGKNVSVVPGNGSFSLRVSRNGSALATVPMPGDGESVEAAGIRFARQENRVVATYDGTRLVVATRESYGG